MSFQTPLQVERRADGRRTLIAPLLWDDGVLRIEVPRGFDTDFSSVPRLLSPLMPRWDRLDRAGVLHDYLYRQQYPRQLSDSVWWLVAKLDTGSKASAWVGYFGLRLGGWRAYRQRGRTT